MTVKCLLIYPNPESALDEEAGKLLLENYQSYCDRAKLITSVHATPRVRPAEFDEPSEEESSAASAPSSKPPSVSVPPVPTLPIISRKSSSPAPVSHGQTRPLVSSPANLSLEKDGRGVANKERHTSPSPLGTADANVAAKNAVVPPSPANKAVKRAATGVAGAEKRKKALKRL